MTFEISEFSFKVDKGAIERLAGGEEVGRALEILGQVGETAAKEHAPVKTGHLRRSITHELIDEGTRNIHARVGTNVQYAVFQEFGTRFHAAHPFLRPALAAVEEFLRRI